MNLRGYLGIVTVGWIVLAISNGLFASHLLTDWLVAGLSASAGLCAGVLVFKPPSRSAYRLGGTLGIGAIAARIATILTQTNMMSVNDIITSITVNVMFFVVYWTWWLDAVGPWHIMKRREQADG